MLTGVRYSCRIDFFSAIYLHHVLSLAGERGTLSWLSALPVEQHGFALYKGVFTLQLYYIFLPLVLYINF